MKLSIQETNNLNSLGIKHWDVCITSKPLDDRGIAALTFIKQFSNDHLILKYLPSEICMMVNESKINAEDDLFLNELNNKSIILDATTLGFAELLLTIKKIKNIGIKKIEILYAEPLNYNNPRNTSLLSKRDFELSGEMFGYKAIPGTTLMLSDRANQRGVFLLGYEASRFDRVLEDFEIDTSNSIIIFGVPAFKAGWEVPSLANNVRVIKDKNVHSEIQYCSAANPDSTFKFLKEVYYSLQDEERMFIVPISSTPMSIGVILFLLNHNDVGILYDHPERSLGRSNSVSKWHLYEIEF